MIYHERKCSEEFGQEFSGFRVIDSQRDHFVPKDFICLYCFFFLKFFEKIGAILVFTVPSFLLPMISFSDWSVLVIDHSPLKKEKEETKEITKRNDLIILNVERKNFDGIKKTKKL